MASSDATCRLETLRDIGDSRPTLIEGLPGLGMVAAIAVDQITKQLDLQHYGNIRSDDFPRVATFQGGRVVDAVRVYAGQEPDVMTLQSAMPIPPPAYAALSGCVLNKLAKDFERAVFLVGAPAQDEDELGNVVGIATNDEQTQALKEAGIETPEGVGIIGGPTGALVNACYEAEVPAIALIVKANPYVPDPGAAHALIEEALEPLVDFDIDTSELEEQAEKIQHQLQQVAEQLRRMQQGDGGEATSQPQSGMYV